MMLLFSPLQTVRPVPALMRFSAPVKKHWLGSFSIVLPRSGLRGFVPVVGGREQGPPAAGGPGTGKGGGGGIPWRGAGGCGDPGPESIYGYMDICIYVYVYRYKNVNVYVGSCLHGGCRWTAPWPRALHDTSLAVAMWFMFMFIFCTSTCTVPEGW